MTVAQIITRDFFNKFDSPLTIFEKRRIGKSFSNSLKEYSGFYFELDRDLFSIIHDEYSEYLFYDPQLCFKELSKEFNKYYLAFITRCSKELKTNIKNSNLLKEMGEYLSFRKDIFYDYGKNKKCNDFFLLFLTSETEQPKCNVFNNIKKRCKSLFGKA